MPAKRQVHRTLREAVGTVRRIPFAVVACLLLVVAVGWRMTGAVMSLAPREVPAVRPSLTSEQLSLFHAGPIVTPKDDPVERTEVTISAVGDCTLGSDYRFARSTSIEGRLDAVGGDPSYFFGGVADILSNDDLTIANLETTLTSSSRRAEKSPAERAFWFRGDPSLANVLTAGSVEVVNVANNHSHDYLAAGFRDTLRNLKQADIGYFGYQYVYSTTIKGVSVGLLGFENFPATNQGADLERFKKTVTDAVKSVRKNTDLVIVSFHWGQEYAELPTRYQVSLGHAVIDAGADLILGHHPHILQGIETYRGRHIVYSLGNFVFGGNVMVKDGGHSMIYQETFVFEESNLVEARQNIIPASYSSSQYQNDYRPKLLEGDARQDAVTALETRTILLEHLVNGAPTEAIARFAELRRLMNDDGQGGRFETPPLVSGTDELTAPDFALVDIQELIPNIVLEPVYATSDNVVGERLYYRDYPYLRAGTARKLSVAQQLAEKQGLGLKVWDAYRPPEVQWLLWETRPDPRYVASPLDRYSLHNRGAAVDITLVDASGTELSMPSGFDDLSARANRSYETATQEQIQNAVLLQEIMTTAGFRSIYNEWWHFGDTDSDRYRLVDIHRVLAGLSFADDGADAR